MQDQSIELLKRQKILTAGPEGRQSMAQGLPQPNQSLILPARDKSVKIIDPQEKIFNFLTSNWKYLEILKISME